MTNDLPTDYPSWSDAEPPRPTPAPLAPPPRPRYPAADEPLERTRAEAAGVDEDYTVHALEDDPDAPLDATVEPPEDENGQPVAPWRITDLGAATWASEKARAALNEIARVDAWEKAEIARIKEVADALRRPDRRTADYMLDRLGEYLTAERAAGRTTRKTLPLPGGTVKLTSRHPLVEVNTAAFVAWAERSAPHLLRVKTEINKAELNRVATLADDGVVTLDGEIVEGATWTAQPDSVTFAPEGE